MRIDESDILPPRDIRLLELARVAEYLQSIGWVENPAARRDYVRIFQHPSARTWQATVPTVADLDDYDLVLGRSLAVVAQFERKPVQDVFENIYHFADDVIEMADHGAGTESGYVPFLRGDHLYSGIKKTLLATAHLEIEPKQHYVRLQRSDAETFLLRCQLGQTKRGSYVMTVACPLNAVEVQPPPAPPPRSGSLFASMEPPPPPPPPPQVPFTRRVTARLMSSAKLLTRCAREDDIESAVQTFESATLISTNLCESLYQLAPESPGDPVELGVRWARRIPLSGSLPPPDKVTLRYEDRPFLESVRRVLRASRVPDVRQTFIGRVDAIDGEVNDRGRHEGNVYFQVIDEQRQARRVRVWLPELAHHKAVEAYDQNLAIRFTGVLKVAGGESYTVDECDDFRVDS